MNRQDLINDLRSALHTSKVDADEAVNLIIGLIGFAIARGEEVRLSGFGTFRRVETKARACRNPKTGEIIEIAAGHKVKFRASEKLVAHVVKGAE